MSVLPIITGADHPVLRAKAKAVPKVTKEIRDLLRDMQDTMLEVNGMGIAAPQVGHSLRMCLAVIDGKVTPLINPRIIARSKETNIDQEGCLSLPNVWLMVPRAVEITLKYVDHKGKKQERKLKNFDARVVQHEVDHLEGVLIVDYAKTPIGL